METEPKRVNKLEIYHEDQKIGEAVDFSFNEAEQLDQYDPGQLDVETFKKRYAGFYQKDNGKRLSKSSLKGIWRRFVERERHSFFAAHTNLTMYDVARIGIDKFIYTMGWRSKADISRWHNNKVRIGVCCHCQDQFIPMMLQHNFGLCQNCGPLYSKKAVRQFIVKQLNDSERYRRAHRDLLMDFFIMFYNDPQLRELFLKDSAFAKECEALNAQIPDWVGEDANGTIDIEGEVVSDGES